MQKQKQSLILQSRYSFYRVEANKDVRTINSYFVYSRDRHREVLDKLCTSLQLQHEVSIITHMLTLRGVASHLLV